MTAQLLELELPAGFAEFLQPLHERFTPRQRALVDRRHAVLERALAGSPPHFLHAGKGRPTDWRIALPAWCRDQRNQMTGPADDAELVEKLLASGAPGVMLDLEDSIVNRWEHVMRGHANIVAALERAAAQPASTVIWSRVRGLHISQPGVFAEPVSAALFDVALLAYRLEPARLPNGTLCIYIPKSESAEEALWWRDLFDEITRLRGWRSGTIKCMALLEAHPLAYELEAFAYNLRAYLLGLNLGRWDYLASLIHYTLNDPRRIFPDRNAIPIDAPFFQRVRTLLVETSHKHGMLAIGGMTALYPNRQDPALNARALEVLQRDKKNEADCLMDGAWTGHPDQNTIAIAQFPYPNQIERRPAAADPMPELRLPAGAAEGATLQGTHAAIRTVIRYRYGVLAGKGASLLDGYMEDLATDRIYRLIIAQRARFPGPYTPASLGEAFDRELERILRELPDGTPQTVRERYRDAREISEELIRTGAFDPT